MYRFRDTLPIDISEQTISGDLVTIENPEEMGVVDSLEVSLSPIQDLNGYDKPWVGGAGKNLFWVQEGSDWSGISCTLNSKGAYVLNGTTASGTPAFIRSTAVTLKAGTYRLWGKADNNPQNRLLVRIRNATTMALMTTVTPDNGTGANVSIAEDTSVLFEVTVYDSSTLTNTVVYPQLEVGTTKTEWEPYSNICPISGRTEVVTQRTGKNLLRNSDSMDSWHAATRASIENGEATINGSSSAWNAELASPKMDKSLMDGETSYVWSFWYKSEDVCYVLFSIAGASNNPYATSWSRTRYVLWIGAVNLPSTNGTWQRYVLPSRTISIDDLTSGTGAVNSWYLQLYARSDVTIKVRQCQLEIGDTATDYETGVSDLYTTALGRTVYGGTLDVVSGVLTVHRAMVDMGSLSWARITTATTGKYRFSTTSLNTIIKKPSSYMVTGELFCSIFAEVRGDAPYSNVEGVGIHTNGNVLVYSEAFANYTVEEFVTAVTGQTLVYPLATPQTYQLTPQQIDLLLGTNHLWSDGEISVVWHKDLTKGRILPTEAVAINGQYIEDAISGYRTLYTKGRESLGAELNTYSVGTADGEKFKNKRYPARELTIGFQLIADNPQEFRNRFNALNNLLSIEEADFIFNDETDKFFSGYPIMDAEVEAGQNSVKGEWKIYCAYPFKRSVEPITLTMEDATVTDATATFTIDYKGARPARPVLRAKFAGAKSSGTSSEDGDCGFVAFVDQEENIIQLGNPDVLDLDEYTQAKTLINKEFVNVTDWTRTGGHTYKGTVTGSVSTSNITDTYWNGGVGQTQSYAKPSYGSGSDLHGAILWKNTEGAVNFSLNLVHRMCCANPNETGVFECGTYTSAGVMVAGFVIDKSSNGTTGIVRYIANGQQVGSEQIDLSYYNNHFGYCNRTPVYVDETYYDPVTETWVEQVVVKKKKKKKKKYVTRSRVVWVARTRTVFSNWNYTQSNLNSSIKKDGSSISFRVGNLPLRTYNVPDTEQMVSADASCFFGTYGSPLNTNCVHSLVFRREAGVPFAEQPNVFTAGDIVEADCNEATVYIYRAGSIGGHLEPQYGALGNDWEDFMLTSGTNVIKATWSEWVNTSYKPQIEIEYNEVFI